MTLDHSNNKRSTIELIAKLVIGLIIAGLLAGIFAVLITRFPANNNNNNVTSFHRYFIFGLILFLIDSRAAKNNHQIID
jgi:hypothetical protein